MLMPNHMIVIFLFYLLLLSLNLIKNLKTNSNQHPIHVKVKWMNLLQLNRPNRWIAQKKIWHWIISSFHTGFNFKHMITVIPVAWMYCKSGRWLQDGNLLFTWKLLNHVLSLFSSALCKVLLSLALTIRFNTHTALQGPRTWNNWPCKFAVF